MSERTYYVALEGIEGEIAVLVDLTPEQFEGVKKLRAQIDADIKNGNLGVETAEITAARPAEPDDESSLQVDMDLDAEKGRRAADRIPHYTSPQYTFDVQRRSAGVCVATVAEFPSLSWVDATEAAALSGLQRVMNDAIKEGKEQP